MKVLLITHNPVSKSNNMGKTVASLFSEFPKESLCQLYVRAALPEVDLCHSYYRVTDKEALTSIFTFKSRGREITSDMLTSTEAAEPEQRQSFGLSERQKSQAFSRLGRDAVWKLSHWYSKDLRAWLDREKPTCIFLAPGYAKMIYDIALRISKDRHIPLVTYVCDDYYFIKSPPSLAGKRWLKLLRRKIEATMRQSAFLITISDGLREQYQKAFGLPAMKIMTGAEWPLAETPRLEEKPVSISYFGNLSCRRHVALRDVGEALLSLNQRMNTSYVLNVYTADRDPELLSALSGLPTVRLCGFVTGEALRNAVCASSLLLHVEAFDEQSVDLVKYSISTKIADSLASGIPLVAYGPAEVASMKHLAEHDCAITCTSRDSLAETLTVAFNREDIRTNTARQALKVAQVYHDRQVNSRKLRQALIDLKNDQPDERI